MEYPHVSLIILNWKGWMDTIECLESVYQINYPNYDVLIVNNGTEDSLNNIKEYFGNDVLGSGLFKHSQMNISTEILNVSIKLVGNEKSPEYSDSYINKQLILIDNQKNCGFADGNNIGTQYALTNLVSDYVLLLNNDTLVDKNFLNELVNVAENHVNAGSVQSLLLKSDEKSTVDSSGQQMLTWGAKEISEPIETPTKQEIEIFGACAASALYRGDLIKKIGLFDSDFFVLLEDVDLSWKIRLYGLKSYLAVNSVVYHKRGISKTNSMNCIFNTVIHKKNPEKVLKWYHESKNWLIIFIRYYPLRMVFISLFKCPKKVFLTFLLFSYSSIKIGKAKRGIRLLLNNNKIRKKNRKNKLLKDIQNKWIK